MSKLTTAETQALYRAVEAEHAAQSAAADAIRDFGSVPVFAHLRGSAVRHIAKLCDTLHDAGANAPLLAPVPPTNHASLTAALNAATERETETAAIYAELMHHTNNPELKQILLPLWQSVSHLHLTAITDQLAIEEQSSR